jgi:hypothetical protein
MTLVDIKDPIERFIAFIYEREAIRVRRECGDPWPWTSETILQQYRFTNINRENDKVSKHYQKTIRDHYGEESAVLPATMLYRWFNRPETCDAFFSQPDMLSNLTVFEKYLIDRDWPILICCLDKLPTPHVTGAYIINGMPGYSKGQGVLAYFHEWCKKPWLTQWEVWRKNPPLLAEIDEWINGEGLGSFMRAQIVADLKYLPCMPTVPDWWTWAAPGPGSMRGLNIVLGRSMDQSWAKGEWLMELNRLSAIVNPRLEELEINRLHNQDLQNCLCEFSKFTKVATGVGRPRQVFRHV